MFDNKYKEGDMHSHNKTAQENEHEFNDEDEKGIQMMSLARQRLFNESDQNKINYFAKKRMCLYKTEMCRSFEEAGFCKYGDRCQFAHTGNELRSIQRHPRYKTETCRTFWEEGTCPYGKRCCFIHMENTESSKIDEHIESTMETKILTDKIDLDIDITNHTDLQEESMGLEFYMFNGQKKQLPNIEINDESDDSLLSQIKFNHTDLLFENDSKTDKLREIFIDDEYNNIQTDELQEMRPFWHTNEANIWVPEKQSFCYIQKHINTTHRSTKQPQAPGEPVYPDVDPEIVKFVFNKLGL